MKAMSFSPGCIVMSCAKVSVRSATRMRLFKTGGPRAAHFGSAPSSATLRKQSLQTTAMAPASGSPHSMQPQQPIPGSGERRSSMMMLRTSGPSHSQIQHFPKLGIIALLSSSCRVRRPLRARASRPVLRAIGVEHGRGAAAARQDPEDRSTAFGARFARAQE